MRAFASLVVLLTIFLAQRAADPPALDLDRILGTWAGDAEHAGSTSRVVVTFERTPSGAVRTVVSLPAIHARMGIGPARIVENRVEVGPGPAVFDYDAAAGTLTTVLPAELVPKYRLRVTLRPSAPIAPPQPRTPQAPVRQPIWTVELGAPIWSDIAFVDGLAILGADDGRVHAVEGRTGRIVWSFKTGGAVRARASRAGNDVIVPSDDGWLYRLDARTGTERWRVQIADAPAVRVGLGDQRSRYENRASAAAIDGDRLYIGTHQGRLLARRTDTGAQIWAVEAVDSITATPVVANGTVYCGSFDHHLYAVDAASGALRWKHDAGEAITTAAAIAGGRVIGGSRSYDLEAFEAATGRPAWTTYFWFSWVESPPTPFGGTIYVGSSDAAKVFAVDSASGRSIWEADAGGSAWGQPAVTEATVYEGVAGVLGYIAPHRGSVMAFDRRTGAVRWWFPAPAPESAPGTLTGYGFAGSVAVGGGRVFAGAVDGKLHAFAQ